MARCRREIDDALRQGVDRHAQGARGRDESLVVAGQFDGLSLIAEKLQRREVQGVERAHANRKWLEGAREHGRHELQEGQPTGDLPDEFAMRFRALGDRR